LWLSKWQKESKQSLKIAECHSIITNNLNAKMNTVQYFT
jgi:hypothetical protein